VGDRIQGMTVERDVTIPLSDTPLIYDISWGSNRSSRVNLFRIIIHAHIGGCADLCACTPNIFRTDLETLYCIPIPSCVGKHQPQLVEK